MPWERPTLKQLYERISTDFSGRLLDGASLMLHSVLAVLAKVWSGACHTLHGLLFWLYAQVFIDTAEDEHLRRWARVWGLDYLEASFAGGYVVFTGTDGARIPAGTLMQYQLTGLQYALETDAVITTGSAMVRLLATTPGAAANLPGLVALSLVAPIAGVQAEAKVHDDGITGGADAETTAQLRSRLLDRLRKPPRGGSKPDFEAWALEVPGVTRAWCYPLGAGIGTVSLTFVTDNAPDGPIPSPEVVQRVQAHIDELRPASVKDWECFAPEVLPVTVRLKVVPDVQTVRDAVLLELDDFFRREAKPDTTLYISRISEAISLAAGETDHILIEPAQNVEVPAGCFPLLAGVIFEG